MKILIVFALLVTTVVVAHGQTANSSAPGQTASQTTRVERELLTLNQQLIDALARRDKTVVSRIYADDFVRVSVNGEVLTKAQVLDALSTPQTGARISYESRDIRVIDYGQAAILVYLSIRHTDNKGTKTEFYYRVTDTFVKKKGRWVKAASVGTPIPQVTGTSKLQS